MFLIQEMLIVMAVNEKKKKSVPCIQQVPRHKEYQWNVVKPVKVIDFLKSLSNPNKNKQ